MGRYAENTSVPVEKSRAEIEATLSRYGAKQFAYGWDQEKASIGFRMNDRSIRFVLQLPDKNADEFKKTPSRGRVRSTEDTLKTWEQACRQRWRALALGIKAKLESVEAGIASFEDEFLSHIVLPGGETVGTRLLPEIEKIYSGKHKEPTQFLLLGNAN